MKIKEGGSWKAGYNEAKGLYGGEVICQGDWDYYEISAEVYNSLTKGMSDHAAEELIRTGRHLYSHVNDRYNPPYTIVFDEANSAKPIGISLTGSTSAGEDADAMGIFEIGS